MYYDAKHPSQAVLDPSLSGGVFVPLPLGLLFLGLLFLGLGWLVFRNRGALEAAAQTTEPE